MAASRHTRYRNDPDGDPQEERRRTRRSSSSSAGPILALVALVVLIGGAVIVAQQIDSATRASSPEEGQAEHVPFGSLPPEPLPEPRKGGGVGSGPSKPAAPPGLDQDATWKRALSIAETAWGHVAAAATARAAGDDAGVTKEGLAAKDAFDEAFTMTAAWEEEIVGKYGDRDPQVRAIVRTRNKWIDKIGEYRKAK